MITLERKTSVQKQIAKYLLDRAKNDIIKLHTKQVEREIIPDGLGCLSVSRYIRAMRQIGLIDYEDPRKTGHFYIIKIKPELKEWLKEIKNERN
jgi:hypothetical protein